MSSGGCWPDAGQRLLLRTLLSADDEEARRAWREWRSRVEFESIDAGSLRLLPSLCRRLVELEIEDAVLGRIKGLWRRTWYENSRRVDQVTGVVTALRTEGIDGMLLKGLALALTVYRDLGERPMVDADLLVPIESASEALEILKSFGLSPVEPRPEALMRVLHGVGLRHENGLEVDLHWHAAKEFCSGDADEAIFRQAHSTDLKGVEVLLPSPSHLLLLSVLHGVQWCAVPPVRWVADAARILESGETVDWAGIVELAEEIDRTLVVLRGLELLREFSPAVPDAVITMLKRLPRSRAERAEMRSRETPEGTGLFGNLPRTLLHYHHLSRGRPFARRIVGLPQFLTDWWQLERWTHLPGVVARKAFERFRRSQPP